MGQISLNIPPIVTTNATPVVVSIYTFSTLAGKNAVLDLLFFITAVDAAGNAMWGQISRGAKALGLGNAVLIGSALGPGLQKDTGATAWAATLGVSGRSVIATITGAAGVTITWNIGAEGLLG